MACNEQTVEMSEPSDENFNEKESNDPAQTSTETNSPGEAAHNVNDLKLLDFNSADEVRQRMKSVLAGKGPNYEDSSEDFIAVDAKDQEQQRNKLHLHLMSKLIGTDDLKLGDKEMMKSIKPLTLRVSKKDVTRTSKKRPGRPPKAGPSKKLKKQRVSTLYLGKLSNVVFLKRYRGNKYP